MEWIYAFWILVIFNLVAMLFMYGYRKRIQELEHSANVRAAQQTHEADHCWRCGAPAAPLYLCENHYEELVGYLQNDPITREWDTSEEDEAWRDL